MAMTKKEQAAIDKAELLAALRWTHRNPWFEVKPDVSPPDVNAKKSTFRDYTQGWTFNAYTRTVEQGWSSSVNHGSGPKPAEGKRSCSASQGPRSLFSTKKLALEALRCDLELQYAKLLLDVDRRIRDEKGV